MACKHETPQWHLADCNEDGWKCAECGHAFGFRPDFDREHITDKVETILFWLVEHDFLYVSNATEGESIVARIAEMCRESDCYDQQSIVARLASLGLVEHALYWRRRAQQFFCYHPARELRDGKSVCQTCDHEVKQAPVGGLFAGMETP